MSNIVKEFDPTIDTSTQFSAPQSAVNGALVFFNESLNSIKLSFANGDDMYLPAWYHRHKCGVSGSVNISWEIHTVLSSGQPPTSKIVVEAFRAGEHFPADGPLVRQTNGDVSSTTVSAQASNLTNTGNAPLTNLITAQPNDAATPTWSADNSGNLTVKGDNAGVLTTLLQLAAGGAPAVTLAASGVLTTLLGNLLVDGTINTSITPVTQNGAIGGSVSLFQDFVGSIKRVWVEMANYQDNQSTLALPVAFVSGAIILAGGIGNSAGSAGVKFLLAGVAKNPRVLTALAATGGTTVGQSTLFEDSFGFLTSAFDSLQFPAATAPHSGGIVIIGR